MEEDEGNKNKQISTRQMSLQKNGFRPPVYVCIMCCDYCDAEEEVYNETFPTLLPLSTADEIPSPPHKLPIIIHYTDEIPSSVFENPRFTSQHTQIHLHPSNKRAKNNNNNNNNSISLAAHQQNPSVHLITHQQKPSVHLTTHQQNPSAHLTPHQ